MKKHALSAIALTLLLAGAMTLSSSANPVLTSLRVHNINTNLNYATIQDAINATETINGQTILVDAGVYYENVVVNKALSLIGEGRDTTIIDGSYLGNVTKILTSNVTITSFTIRNSGADTDPSDYGLVLDHVSGCNIFGNNITTNWNYGIFLSRSSENNMSGNSITNSGYGIFLDSASKHNVMSGNEVANNSFGIGLIRDSSDNSITGNNITANYFSGIELVSSNNSITGNNITANNQEGINLYNSFNNSIVGNDISAGINDDETGIHLYLCSDNNITENLITNTYFGIWLEDSSNNRINRNNITANIYCGIEFISATSPSSNNSITGNNIANNCFGLSDPANNTIYHNNFLHNIYPVYLQPAFDQSINSWDNGYPSGGNYWSDYDVVDLNGDGIGDTAYVIGANNRDRYPLMSPWCPAYFQDGFESGSFSRWTGTDVSSGETVAVVNVPTHHGLYSGRFTSNGGGGFETAYCYETVASSTELYVRGYFQVSQSGITSNDQRFHFIVLMAGTTPLAYAGWRMTGGVVKWTVIIRDGTNPTWPTAYSTVTPSLNRWYCVELHWKMDAVNGLGELWVDGTRVCSLTGKNTALQGNVNVVRFGLGDVYCGSTTVYGDCAKIANYYIGEEPVQPGLVVRGMDDRIYYRVWNETGWEDWKALPGATIDSPAAAMLGNELHIVVRGSDGYSLWHGYINMTDNKFTGWTMLSGSTPSAPTLTSNGTILCLVVRGEDNRIYYRCYSGSWGSWYAVPTGATPYGPAAAMLGDNLTIVVRGMDGASLWQTIIRTTDNSVVKGWTLISGATPSKPVLTASAGTGRIYLVVRGNDNTIYYRSYDALADSWGSWVALTGSTIDGPGTVVASGWLHVIVRGSSGSTLWHGHVDLSSTIFSGWTLLTGSTPSAPTLTG